MIISLLTAPSNTSVRSPLLRVYVGSIRGRALSLLLGPPNYTQLSSILSASGALWPVIPAVYQILGQVITRIAEGGILARNTMR